ncbi:hypothetical protein OLF92_11200, partial [Streptococcus pneumoniae]|nr:hypothetical protein [Streptococcus pneumoniae]
MSIAALTASGAVRDLVTLVKAYGSSALPREFDFLPHMRQPTWRRATAQNLSVQVRAKLYRSKGVGDQGAV